MAVLSLLAVLVSTAGSTFGQAPTSDLPPSGTQVPAAGLPAAGPPGAVPPPPPAATGTSATGETAPSVAPGDEVARPLVPFEEEVIVGRPTELAALVPARYPRVASPAYGMNIFIWDSPLTAQRDLDK